ncbi:MAG: DNA polymerase/3'-5' exonuclease PolX [Flavisolibacter sp.]|nr:DNA polymerase/3'-5' exonuclease PolX [Flavisolibacter sp.]
MDNYTIAEELQLLSKLMDIHGENAFKAKSYSAAAFAIEKFPQELSTLPKEKIFSIRGIGESVGKKIAELIETGELKALKELLDKTPAGVLEMMNIKGLGPKKIHLLWKELHISTIDELKEACQQNRIAEKKGFGEKTQQKILEAIHFQQQSSGKFLYAQVESFTEALQQKLVEKFETYRTEITGSFRRQLEVIEKLEWVTTVPKEKLLVFIDHQGFQLTSEGDDIIGCSSHEMVHMIFYLADDDHFATKLFTTSSSPEFLMTLQQISNQPLLNEKSEEAIFQQYHLPYIPPYLREKEDILINKNIPTAIIQTSDIKGLIHAHSNWSDGGYAIDVMAHELIDLGFEYLVLSDHSKAAFYASGLSEQRIKEQHRLIDELNKELTPFKIYKSIECDILNDGRLDYEDQTLSTFDLVIASIHSNLDMTEEKAMQRLMGAVNNPYVSILGHMTGRILLRRKGYPVDHKAIIDACAANNVVIEINASPHRLDMDWRWIDYALERGILLSINPDAHTLDEFALIKYGVLVAQKGALTKEKNLSSFSRKEFEAFLAQQYQKRTKVQATG